MRQGASRGRITRLRRAGRSGLTLVEVAAVLAIILLLAALAYPSYRQARSRSHLHLCINNLRQIQYAKEQWAMAGGLRTGDPVDPGVIRSYLAQPPVCPADGMYEYNPVGTPPTCTFPEHILP